MTRAAFRGQAREAQNRDNIAQFRAWLVIAYVHMVNPQQVKRLREAFENINA